MTYKEMLASPKWQKKRLEILSRDNWACTKCGETEKQLQVHHNKYTPGKHPADYPNENLVTLCYKCHEGKHKTKPTLEFLLTNIQLFHLRISEGGSANALATWRRGIHILTEEIKTHYPDHKLQ